MHQTTQYKLQGSHLHLETLATVRVRLEKLKKSWNFVLKKLIKIMKNHAILSVQKNGNPEAEETFFTLLSSVDISLVIISEWLQLSHRLLFW